MALSIEQLEAFMAAVETGSFSGAARRLGKAQSSVSGLIHKLEDKTGLNLFDRSRRDPILTEDGNELLRDIKTVLNAHRKLQMRVSSLQTETSQCG
ncbi:LysR family transcriptional regulator [Lacimicrobium sp. SS2-24]|uniref:LysR family transcriptional regulator n=1 Tax=Lacimicrobium sp. SS2-24 TaxID=2005569 RepID=UPI000B4A7FC9|nr:LysR family transcriptional regulator [Lacimicrobium sp. SS2-24]